MQKYVEVEEPEEEEMEIMAAEKELSGLDEQFSGLLLDNEMADNMQVHGSDDDIDFDAPMDDDSDVADDDLGEDDDLGFGDGADMGADDDMGDFDE